MSNGQGRWSRPVDLDDRYAHGAWVVVVSQVTWLGFVIEVEFEGDTLSVDDRNDTCSGEVDNIEDEWAGPMEPPE